MIMGVAKVSTCPIKVLASMWVCKTNQSLSVEKYMLETSLYVDLASWAVYSM